MKSVKRGKEGPPMLAIIVNFFALLLASLVVGAMFGVWLSFDPEGLQPAFYVALQQHGIAALNVAMPRLGGVAALLTILAAWLARGDPTRLALFAAAAVCVVAAGLITRFLNQPINAVVMTWSPESPPGDWMQLRDAWWRWHIVRTAIGVCGLGLLIAATLSRASAG